MKEPDVVERQPGRFVKYIGAVWYPCKECDGAQYVCRIHSTHVEDCPCPAIEVWMAAGLDPFGSVDTEVVEEFLGEG